ncbi:leucine-rich repeat domain-containing protein [Microscilla marina]|uniref:Leucine-rich repeat containing protein n=1 Tax=Microscilla marina ATCC 23134 TaxID=313606 RepID=A1ZRE6_MICM2|nr:leucine-rich repeat domain-containing protein [Microscilla marina]EAY27036.1 leucine-rich repeat containing protein [Microscilla marina ATCC 23134]
MKNLLTLCLLILVYTTQAQIAKISTTGKYYFVDLEGKQIKKLGSWKYAKSMDIYTGWMQVKDSNGVKFLLDKTGKTYKVAYQLKDIQSDTQALDLSQQSLTSLPAEVLQATQLKVLLLHSTGLEALPQTIAQLTNLECLNLRGNDLTELPAIIGKFTHLKKLDLESNELTRLPVTIGKLTKLESLNLNYNYLMQLPSSIGKLINLKKLEIQDNQAQLDKLPSSMGKLTSLLR